MSALGWVASAGLALVELAFWQVGFGFGLGGTCFLPSWLFAGLALGWVSLELGWLWAGLVLVLVGFGSG